MPCPTVAPTVLPRLMAADALFSELSKINLVRLGGVGFFPKVVVYL